MIRGFFDIILVWGIAMIPLIAIGPLTMWSSTILLVGIYAGYFVRGIRCNKDLGKERRRVKRNAANAHWEAPRFKWRKANEDD